MMMVSGILEKCVPRGSFFVFKGGTTGFFEQSQTACLVFPLVVESIRAPWERLCPPGKVIAPRVLSFNDNSFKYFAEGLQREVFCF